jgi:hypothetical protein
MTIAEVEAAHFAWNEPPVDPAQIERLCRHTIVVVTNAANATNRLKMPSGCFIGDLIEIYTTNGGGGELYPPDSETLEGANGSGVASYSNGTLYRKITATHWRMLQFGNT